MKKYLFTVVLLLVTVASQNALAALSAVVTAVQSPVTINQQAAFSVAISNTSASALTLTSLIITASANGDPTSRVAWAPSLYNFGPNATQLSLPANLTTTVPMNA